MDYMREINAFERWLETNYLPCLSQLLWYRLMALCNRAGWPEWVIVDNQRLMGMIQSSREATFVAVRDKLIESGLVEFIRGKKGSPNRYKLVSFTFKNEVQSVVQTEVQSVVQTEVQSVVQTVDISSYPSDTQKTKTNTNTSQSARDGPGRGARAAGTLSAYSQEEIKAFSSSAVGYCQAHLAAMSHGNYEELRKIQEEGLPDELIRFAVDETTAQNRRHWGYARSILYRFLRDGIKTLGEARASQDAWSEKNKPAQHDHREVFL